MHWISCEKLVQAKGEGGLGFRGVSDFKLSLPGKHYWCLLTDNNSLVSKVLNNR